MAYTHFPGPLLPGRACLKWARRRGLGAPSRPSIAVQRKERTRDPVGIFHNGATDLPVADTPSGVLVASGTLEDMHASYQRILVDQVRQGILAEQLGFDFFLMTEHHFQPEGAEFSPNPMMAEIGRSRPRPAASGSGRPPTS